MWLDFIWAGIDITAAILLRSIEDAVWIAPLIGFGLLLWWQLRNLEHLQKKEKVR